jgi:hypothetical protein
MASFSYKKKEIVHLVRKKEVICLVRKKGSHFAGTDILNWVHYIFPFLFKALRILIVKNRGSKKGI